MINNLTAAKALTVRELCQELLENEKHAHIIRRVMRERMISKGVTWVYDLILKDDDEKNGSPWEGDEEEENNGGLKKGIHDLAREMLKNGYNGQGLREREKAYDYILLAADNPNVEDELPDAGFSFWKACEFQYRIWKAKKARGEEVA